MNSEMADGGVARRDIQFPDEGLYGEMVGLGSAISFPASWAGRIHVPSYEIVCAKTVWLLSVQ